MIKKLSFTLALLLVFAVSPVFSQDAVFDSMDSAQEVQKINLEPVDSNAAPEGEKMLNNVVTQPQDSSDDIQSVNFKNAISNLDNAQVDVREQLVNYNSQLMEAQKKYDITKAEVKNLKKQVKATKKKLKNIEKSKKIIQENLGGQE